LLRGTVIEALHNPTVGTNIKLEFLAETLLGNKPLVPTNKLFKSPLGLLFECRGIARAVPIKIDKIEVHLDFHIFAILDFDLFIGYPNEKHCQQKLSHGSLNEKLGKTAFATPIFHLQIPMVKHHPNHDSFEEVKFVSLFVSPELSSHPCEIEHPSSPLLELKPCPSSHQNIILDGGRDSTLILHDISLENKNLCATDTLLSTTC